MLRILVSSMYLTSAHINQGLGFLRKLLTLAKPSMDFLTKKKNRPEFDDHLAVFLKWHNKRLWGSKLGMRTVTFLCAVSW
jgi:hypothetical protein